MPELVFFRRGEEVLRVGLEHGRVVLGRGEQSDVVLPDPDISRRHVALQHDGTRCVLEDLSGRGTLVSGKPMAQGELADGADITLGQWRAVFRQRGSGETDSPTGAHRSTALQPMTRQAEPGQSVQVRVKQGSTEFIHAPRGEGFTVGKDPSCEVVIQDRFISGRHLKVTRREGLFHVVDLSSTNGTFLGPTRVFEVEIPLNTCLRVGETELLFEPRTALQGEAKRHGLIGDEPCIRQLMDLVERVAPSSAAVAVFGESGTGKELVARALHACSTRADQPLIPLNCAAISRELIESELFGHERGSFTGAQTARKGAFEEADGGTLFLDEVGELPLDLQAKLLRALESGEIKRVGASRPVHVDVRVVAATNRDLLAASREGKFREDLYYRLCVIPLTLPPLRNRRGDIAPLAEHFVRTYAPRGQAVKLTQAALERLQHYAWPGNVRELRNVVHRALLLRKGAMIDGGDISFEPDFGREPASALPSLTELPPGITLEQMMTRLERQIIEHSLRRHGGNREKVAKELSVARSTLFKRLKDWGLTREDREDPE
ncbi:sigma 54-interacting transcriptional regulator [Stigmatella sp. ncwal1]|uniref:Sigma 54-interacting transcriptional regulator n=1 Tax=Stigmatella ashevillensis TaxID=2995309 RepID=A0ABT5DMF3_9BACT|nr:sigma 54-interacting transcriptional regulator [Stigmatella ashevillena]MDC0714839.1 sigma 54-interacting transcriptional regulator [Stigmatella ashevillena]